MPRCAWFTVLLTVIVTCPTATIAQNIVWGAVVPTTSPSARSRHAMAYDPSRQRVVLYGGGQADTWEWDGNVWAQRFLLSAPGSRGWHTLVYDSARQRTVLFGGQDTAGNYPTDIWQWDGTTWTQSTSATNPGQRWKHAMAFDGSRQRMVLFGGSIPGVVNPNPFAGDTWEWDGTNWSQRFPANSPAGRLDARMAYDEARQRVILFGGQTAANTYAADTWEWDGTNWTQRLPATIPAARISHGLAFDGSRQTIVMFGGYNGTAGYLRDTWEWNGADWIQSTPTVRPSARLGQAMAFDGAHQTTVLFGGFASTGACGDTWSTFLPAVATAYGSGCGSPLPLGFQPDPTARPVVGQIARATITEAPTPLVGVAMGYSNQAFGATTLPLPLDFLGMPGCVLLQSTDVLGFGATPVNATTFTFQLLLPNQPNLMGHRVYLQAYALAPGQNALQVVASNGIEWLFGNV